MEREEAERSQGESDRQAGSPRMMSGGGGRTHLGGTIGSERNTRKGDGEYNDSIPMQVCVVVGCPVVVVVVVEVE